jgi:hypothetical protein
MARPEIGWDGHGLGWPWPGLAMDWASHRLRQTGDRVAINLGQDGPGAQGLGWPWAGLA